ncbi:hypothetical protein AQPE_0633 [Aquipluma nitroreducens]|uniref:Uncharacterized protein n=1 Tax=Aquipluma nitroreducens TaxID=2010828 RepID=A0A5K7S566_9BACT|nr:hypothetical protein AQPE_0633 [Aquipluma nitroreducens]
MASMGLCEPTNKTEVWTVILKSTIWHSPHKNFKVWTEN